MHYITSLPRPSVLNIASASLSLKSEALSSFDEPILEVLFDVGFDDCNHLCISDCKDAGSSASLSKIF